ncbi:MAG: DUF1385 domain-containing protein [Candidatus Zixiibacteriota bacterium]|nr:MAG: DUF1385 domain-containing protein [candidate division Zixibacteria bacterium]
MPDLNVGGQAVIEGVMMRSKDRIATAVRVPSGEILIKTESYVSLSRRYKLLKLPMLRGVIVFFEMLIIGIKTLNFSADIAVDEAEKEEAALKGVEHIPREKKSNRWYLVLTAVFAMALGVFIFFFLPLAIANFLGISRDAIAFNLIAGVIRLTMFVLYVWGISLLKELRRVFEYHGAEHKSIFAYESGVELTPENARTHTRFHPRCGTSFILIVALLAILIYSISDSIFAIVMGYAPGLLTRFGLHFSLLPLVAGASYELLKYSGRSRDKAITRILIKPGLWLQRITTQEPSLEQIEVAIAALEAAEGITDSKLTSKRTPVS